MIFFAQGSFQGTPAGKSKLCWERGDSFPSPLHCCESLMCTDCQYCRKRLLRIRRSASIGLPLVIILCGISCGESRKIRNSLQWQILIFIWVRRESIPGGSAHDTFGGYWKQVNQQQPMTSGGKVKPQPHPCVLLEGALSLPRDPPFRDAEITRSTSPVLPVD